MCDWIFSPHAHLTPFQQFVHDVDWNQSPVGPMAGWPVQLHQMVLIVMADTSPAAVFFGDETTIIYNEPFSHLIGSSHPALQGQSPKSGFAEIWGQFEDLIAAARNGTVTGHRIKPLLLYRNGFLEETYFSWKIIALVGNGGISGFYATAMEVTLERIAERRASTIRNLGRQVASTHEIRDLCTQILRGLEQNEKDIPLALYSLREDDETVQPQGGNVFQLETALGIDPGHALIPRSLNLQVNTNGLAMAFKRSTLSNNQAILSIEDDSLPPDQIRGIQRRSFGACTAIIVCPLQSIMPVSTLGFRIIELNPQQHYDDAYRRFVETLTKQITTAHVNSLALREEFRAKEAAIQLSTTGLQMLDDRLARRTEFRTSEIRGDSEAAQANLAYAKRFEKLAARAIEFEQREMQTSPSAECAAVGLAILSPAGLVLFANQTYHNLAVYSSESGETSSLMDALEPQDWYNTSRLWKSLLLNKEPLKFQLRLKKPWRTPEPEDGNPEHKFTPTSVLCFAFPDIDNSGNVLSVLICLANMSELAWVRAQMIRQTEKLERSEKKWKDFVDKAPIGVSVISPDGGIEFANDCWYILTHQVKGNGPPMAWFEGIHPVDVGKAKLAFADIITRKASASLEFRLCDTRPDPHHSDTSKADIDTSVLASLHVELDLNDNVCNVVVWITDISAQKAVEEVLRNRMDIAIELKHQEENFIDMAYHELRNPLSVILHCAEEIVGSLRHSQEFLAEILKLDTTINSDSCTFRRGSQVLVDSPANLMKEVSGSIEAARTIAFCVQHQSRIVEDISTMFKIDSCLIRISLESRQPRKIVSEALGMFKAELKAASIELEVVSSPELAQLRIGWLLFDPSRVLQILTNLIANAIKFTGSETQGKIIVTIDAFVGEPPSRFDGIVFLPRLGKQTCSVGVDWPAEEVVYLYLSVQDAGPGLNVAEQDLLFGRFYQNTPKTHTKYGGSGLGLYISRNIAEMHGGAIGLSSEVGKGSKFAFFVKSKRTTPDETTSLTESGRTPLSLDSEGYFPSLSPENSESCYVPQEPKPKPRPPIPRSQSKKARGFLVGLKVLLVEDNILNQTVAAKQLRQRGCEVEVANHGQEALNYLRQTAFWRATEPGRALSVVLLDVEMPVMGGLACIRRIRELQSSGDIQGHVPVIAVTANARPGQIAEALKAGMDHVTTKPYRIDDLLEQIERIVENAD